MSVFDGGAYRVRIRHALGFETENFEGWAEDARQLISDAKNVGALAADVSYVHFVTGEDTLNLSFGDYWGDGEE